MSSNMSGTSAQMMQMESPQDLFVHELSMIYSAEQQIVQMLQEAQGMVQNSQLRDGLQMHAEQSRQQAERVMQVMQMIGGDLHPVQCQAAAGLYQDLLTIVQYQPSPMVLEGAVVAGACKTEHFEIACYTGLVEKAQAMGQSQAASLLQQNLQEEQQMLQQVEKIASQLTKQMVSVA